MQHGLSVLRKLLLHVLLLLEMNIKLKLSATKLTIIQVNLC